MKHTNILALAIVALSFTSISMLAQAPAAPAPAPAAQPPATGAPAGGGGGGRGGGGRGGVPARIDNATARRALDAALASAVSQNLNVTIAIVDANGELVLFHRMDGAPAVSINLSQGKARASILFGRPSGEVAAAVAANQPVSATLTTTALNGPQVSILQGGLPIVRNGMLVAGIGVSGATAQQDEVIAQAGVTAVR